jgi:hypothetical protein
VALAAQTREVPARPCPLTGGTLRASPGWEQSLEGLSHMKRRLLGIGLLAFVSGGLGAAHAQPACCPLQQVFSRQVSATPTNGDCSFPGCVNAVGSVGDGQPVEVTMEVAERNPCTNDVTQSTYSFFNCTCPSGVIRQ